MVKIKTILLTFDVEEFDLPNEMNRKISEEEQFRVSKEGTEKVLKLLEKYNIKATFFISAKFAEKYPKLIKEISEKHEIGLHCLEHKDNYSKMDKKLAFERLDKAKKILEKITNKKIKGFRAPRFENVNYKILKGLNFIYDSSFHPFIVYKRYNNLFKSSDLFFKEGIKVIPVSVSSFFYIPLPLFWISFRFMPLLYSKFGTNRLFISQNFICLLFHPWEFRDNIIQYFSKIKFFSRPIISGTGSEHIKKLENYIEWCKNKNYEFEMISDYLAKNKV